MDWVGENGGARLAFYTSETRPRCMLNLKFASVTYAHYNNAMHPAQSWSKNRVRASAHYSAASLVCRRSMYCRMRHGEDALPEKDRGLYLVDPTSKGWKASRAVGAGKGVSPAV